MARARPRQMTGFISWIALYYDEFGEERSAGTFRCRCRGKHPNGKTRCRCGAERQAEELAAKTEAEVKVGTRVAEAGSSMTLNEYFDKHWIDPVQGRVMSINHRATNRQHYKSIRPTLGKMRLADITTGHVEAWLRKQQNSGASANTVRVRLICLRTILATDEGKCALADRLITTNPCQGVKAPKPKRRSKRQSDVFDPNETDQVLDALDPWWREMALTQAETGLRWGEIQGLRVHTLVGTQLEVCRVIGQVDKSDLDGDERFYEKDEPKDREDRFLTITQGLADTLALMIVARGLGPDDRLFAMHTRHTERAVLRTERWPGGRPVCRFHWRRVWERACKDAGVAYRKPYALRASNVTWMIQGGANVADVMRRSGHARLETVMAYLAMFEDDSAGLAALQRTVDNARKATRLDKRRPA